jgi:hypothetical protein
MIATSNDELFEKTDEIAKGPEKGRIGNRERRGFQKIEEAKRVGGKKGGVLVFIWRLRSTHPIPSGPPDRVSLQQQRILVYTTTYEMWQMWVRIVFYRIFQRRIAS